MRRTGILKAGELQILRCQGIAVGYYGFTFDALTLKPSDFCNVGVKKRKARSRWGCSFRPCRGKC